MQLPVYLSHFLPPRQGVQVMCTWRDRLLTTMGPLRLMAAPASTSPPHRLWPISHLQHQPTPTLPLLPNPNNLLLEMTNTSSLFICKVVELLMLQLFTNLWTTKASQEAVVSCHLRRGDKRSISSQLWDHIWLSTLGYYQCNNHIRGVVRAEASPQGSLFALFLPRSSLPRLWALHPMWVSQKLSQGLTIINQQVILVLTIE